MKKAFTKIIHPLSKLESILNSNFNSEIVVGRKIITDYVGSLQDIIEQYGKINLETRFMIVSDITETAKDFRFVITHWSKNHGSYAAYCLESIPTTKIRVVIPKETDT